MNVKKLIYIPILLVLLAVPPVLALAIGPSPVASAAFEPQSNHITYPTADVDTGSADCVTEQTIP